MGKFKVTESGKCAARNDSVDFTDDVITLVDGSCGVAWTMQATFDGREPLDDEGWCPWSRCNVATALELGYIVPVVE